MVNEQMPMIGRADGAGLGLNDSIYNRLLRERIIWLGSEVRDENANAICAQMMLLAAEDPNKDISLYINSPGGSATAMFAIYDTMQHVKPDVVTVCMGMAASAASVLLAAGAPGKRFVLPNARVLIHQPHGGAQGQQVDIEIQAREIAFLRRRMEQVLAFHTGQPIERIARDTDRDFIMGADEAKTYGMVDHVMGDDRHRLPPLPVPSLPMSSLDPAVVPLRERAVAVDE